MLAGFRKAKTFKEVPAGTETDVDRHGNFVFIEVTNATASEVDFEVNHYPQQGHAGATIPIAPNSTRQIPMAVYKFKASGTVTVVAYGN